MPCLEFQTAEPMVPFISWTPLCSSAHSFLQIAKNCHHPQCFLLFLFCCCLSMWQARSSDGYPTWHLSIPLPNVTPSGSSLRQLRQCSHVISQTILQTLITVHVTWFLINRLLLCLPRCFVSSPITSYHRTWHTQLTVRWLCIENIHSSASSHLFPLFLGNKVRFFSFTYSFNRQFTNTNHVSSASLENVMIVVINVESAIVPMLPTIYLC